MAKYFRDPEKAAVWLRVLEAVAAANEAQGDTEYVTYLVRDPRGTDKRGMPGLPIYIGQTKELSTRALSRFQKCEKEAAARGKDCVQKRVAEMLHQGVVAQYEVIDRQRTLLASLVSETNFVRAAVSRGYDMANNVAFQARAAPSIRPQEIPEEWLWKFTLPEAIEDGLEVVLVCSECHAWLPLPASAFAAAEEPPKELSDIRRNAAYSSQPCPDPACKAVGTVRFRVRVEKSRA